MKTKHLFIITISLCIFSCWGCSGKKTAETAELELPPVSENHSDADVVIPPAFMGDELSQIQTEIASEDNGDGSVKYSLSGEMITSTLNQMNNDLADSIRTILDDDDYYPNIANITVSDDYSLFTIFLKDGEMNNYEAMLVMSFYTVGNKFQIYNGTPYDEAVTTVTYVNEADNTVVSQSDSKSMEIFSQIE